MTELDLATRAVLPYAQSRDQAQEIAAAVVEALKNINPDFIADPYDLQNMCDWKSREFFCGAMNKSSTEKYKRLRTLMFGPDIFVTCAILTRNKDGLPTSTELLWLRSEEEAKAVAERNMHNDRD